MWCKLEDIAYVASGSTPDKSSFVSNGIPYIKMYNLRNQNIDFKFKPQFIKEDVHNGKLQRSRTEVGDLIMNIVGPPLGKLALIPPSLPQANFNQAAVLIRPYLHKDIINVYLKAYLEEMTEINSISTKGSAGQVNISLTQSQNMRIPLPPVSEQHRIIKELKHWLSMVDCIDCNKEILYDTLKHAKSKILDLAIHGKLVPQDPADEPASELLKRINPKAEIISDNGHYQKLPEGWAVCTLKNICKVITGSTPSKSNPIYYGGNIPFYKPADLDFGRYVKNASEYLSEEGMCVSRVVPAGSTAVCCIGTIGKVGYLVNAGTTNQQINCAIPSKAVYDVFLFYLCSSSWFYNNLISKSSAVTISIVNKSKMENIEVPLPPLEEQHRIVAKIEEIFAQLDAIEASL
ncbi:restriction endonuclease subunit S [Hallella faecis]|uniref:restriction endonuclease subunit S n=1 Tax=Hallella faecis TaxID=2841596 RepID=UPI003F891813